jgi:type VI secretion system secreted protein Hcp
MAQSAALRLKVNGNDVKGESTVVSNDRADTIEVLQYEHAVKSAREAATGMVTGRRQHEPIFVLKRIDKSSPVLFKALCKNERIDGKFEFCRPDPAGGGTTQMFFTVEITNGNIASIKQILPDTLNPASGNSNAPLEEVTFVFQDIEMTYTDGGASHKDSWSGE